MEAWRQVEVAACEEMDGPTAEDLEAIRAATFTVEAVKEREKVTDHDVAAFVDVLSASAGDSGRWIHFGLTSSDVLDTALALQLRAAGEIVLEGARELAGALAERAREHVDTVCVGPHPRRARRADDVRHQARGLRVRGAAQRRAAGARVRRCRGGRGQRRGRHLLRDVAGVRGARAGAAGPARRAGVDAGRPARPPRRAAAGDRAGGRRAGALRHRDPPPAAHRGARGRGAVPRRAAEGLVGDAAQAQPDHDRADHRAGAAAARLRDRRPSRTWRSGTSATSRTPAPSASRCPTRRSSSTTCSRWRCASCAGWSSTPTACARTSTSPTARCSPSACCSRWSRTACSATRPTGSRRSYAQRAWDERTPLRVAARAGRPGPRPRRGLRPRPLHAPRRRDRRAAGLTRPELTPRCGGSSGLAFSSGRSGDGRARTVARSAPGPGTRRRPRRVTCGSPADSTRDRGLSPRALTARCGWRLFRPSRPPTHAPAQAHERHASPSLAPPAKRQLALAPRRTPG